MQSAFFSPAPPHATMDLRAAAAARGQANASHDAAAPPPSTRARATTNHTPADGADDETAAAGEGATSDSQHRPDAPAKDADAAEDTDAAREGPALASDEDVEAVKDPRGIIGNSAGRYNAALLQRAGSPTRADLGWAERPPPDGIARVAGTIILRHRRQAADHDASPPQDDPDDTSWVDRAVSEMEADFEEHEKHIVRPGPQSKGQRRRQQQDARSRSTNHGDPFTSEASTTTFFENSDDSDSDLEDEHVQHAPHPSRGWELSLIHI